MEEITIEVHPRTAEALATEAAERGYRNRSEYVRQLVLHRSVITSGPPVADGDLAGEQEVGALQSGNRSHTGDDLEEIEAKLDAEVNELKQRIIAVESELENHAGQCDDA